MYRLDKSVQTITILMKNEETKGKFFTENDYGLMVDCCLRELESKNTSRTRVQIFRLLNLIIDHPTWVSNNTERIAEFNSKLENVVIYEDASQEFTVKERE